jgi:methionyl-tRNA formyltransferase
MAQTRHPYPKIAFVGAHVEARAPFRHIVEAGYNLSTLVTLDEESLAEMSGGVDLGEIARHHDIPVLRVKNVNQPEAVQWIAGHAPDVLLVVGWTQLVQRELLAVPKLASLGFHASLLPKYRGRAPVNWAIIHGETVTGNTMITLEPEADSGDIVAQRTIAITDEDDCGTVYQKVGETEVDMLDEVLPLIERGVLPRTPQDHQAATVMPRRRPEDGLIAWNGATRAVYNWVRALTDPYPGAFTFLGSSRIWIWRAAMDGSTLPPPNGHQPGTVVLDARGWPWVAAKDGWIRIVTLQRQGEERLSGQDAAHRFLRAGSLFTAAPEGAR